MSGLSTTAYNLFWNNGIDTEGSNVHTASTLFADPLLDANHQLQASSPAIDAGTAFFEHNGETILDLPPTAFSGAAPDLGKYENLPPPGSGNLPRGSVVNGASFRPAAEPNSAIAPGAIVAIFGTDLASDTQVATVVPLPTTLGDTSVTFNNIPAPLFFVSGTQINAQVPFELVTGAGTVSVQVKRGSETTEAQPIGIAAVSPGVFTLNQRGAGVGAILHAEDFQPVSESLPARPGEFLLIFCTGLGVVQPEVPSGNVAPGTLPLAETLSLPLVNIDGIPALVTFSGLAPGFVGLYQVNAVVPQGGVAGAAVAVVITQNGIASNTVTIAVQ